MTAYDTQIDKPDWLIARLAEGQHGVVSRAQLKDLGLSKTAIQRRIRQGRLLRLHSGVYAVGHRVLRIEGRLIAAVMACGPGAVLSHRSAAAHWNLRPSDQVRIDVTATTSRGMRDPAIQLHRTQRLHPADVTSHEGVPVTSVARTLLDLAGVVSKQDLERALAQAEILRLYDQRAIREVLGRANGQRGARALRASLGAPPAFTRSELERRFLALCERHHLPRPLVNTRVCGFEVDFFWPDARLIVETDSDAYHRTRRAFEEDRRRDAELMLAGHRVVRVTHRRLTQEPKQVARMLLALVTR